MNEFELGKEFSKLSGRISQLESLMTEISPSRVSQLRSDFGEELTFEDTQEELLFIDESNEDFPSDEIANIKAGACEPSRYRGQWKNTKIEASYADDDENGALRKAEDKDNIDDALYAFVKRASSLKCSERNATCVNPAKCREGILYKTNKPLGEGWKCKASKKKDANGQILWICHRYYTLDAIMACKCRKK